MRPVAPRGADDVMGSDAARAGDRPSLLAVTSEAPWPLDSGGHLRSYHLLRRLAGGFAVRLVAPSGHPRSGQPPSSGFPSGRSPDEARSALHRAGIHARLVAVRARATGSEGIRIGVAAVRREPYVLYARHRHAAIDRAMREEIARRRPDAVYLDHLDSLVYAGAAPGIPLVLDMHNVYSSLVARAAGEARGAVRRAYLRREASLIARMERRAARVAHTILAVSDEDARYFSSLGARRVVVVPNGVDCAAYDRPAFAAPGGPPTIVYVGALNWAPNAAAARFLATDVLPAVRRQIPDARLTIVGRNPDAAMLALDCPDSGVAIVANAPDVVPYFRQSHVLAVPLETGGGTRLKILEAFAAALPVVSTPVGCEGIRAAGGTHLIVAQREGFAAAIIGLLRAPATGWAIAERARRVAREQYDWSVVGAIACAAVTEAAMPGPTAPAPRRARAVPETVPVP